MVPRPGGLLRPWPVLASPPDRTQRIPRARRAVVPAGSVQLVYSVSALRNAVEPAARTEPLGRRVARRLLLRAAGRARPEPRRCARVPAPRGQRIGPAAPYRAARSEPVLESRRDIPHRRPDVSAVTGPDRRAYAGPHAAAAEYHGASRAGWLTQVPVRFTFAVPGEPRSRNPIAGVKLVGRRNPRRRELNTSVATYLEAVATFDRWANADPLDGDPWHDALERASILLGWRLKRGVIVPDHALRGRHRATAVAASVPGTRRRTRRHDRQSGRQGKKDLRWRARIPQHRHGQALQARSGACRRSQTRQDRQHPSNRAPRPSRSAGVHPVARRARCCSEGVLSPSLSSNATTTR